MIPVTMAKEPEPFHHQVRIPGLRSIYEMVGQAPPPLYTRKEGKPYEQRFIERTVNGKKQKMLIVRPEDLPATMFASYWTEDNGAGSALDWMLVAYKRICMYSCFRIHPATGSASIDHMVPKSRDWTQVYEWSNYRLASGTMNSRKNDLTTLIDPFDVKDGWFKLNLLSGEIHPGEATDADPVLKQQVQHVIDTLKLHEFNEERLKDIQDYEAGVPIDVLMRESPFVAMEILRQGYTPS